ncbi:MAG: hypothetical protein MUE83_16145 [Tabrizicola sp.]|jgi:hypothetical protein|nr:hypothetical protein [Tabrizicola sp.]
MSRPSKPKPAAAAPAGDPNPASPQGPETTGAASAPPSAAGEAAAVPVVTQGQPQHEPATASGFILRVKGPAKGRWRAGRHFGTDPVDLLAAELTEAQILALNDDPELTVMVLG